MLKAKYSFQCLISITDTQEAERLEQRDPDDPFSESNQNRFHCCNFTTEEKVKLFLSDQAFVVVILIFATRG